MIANKKGFMFVETIVMCAALMLGLLIIYNSYTSSIAREKRRVNYNTIEGQYKLIAIKQYLQNVHEWSCTKLASGYDCEKAKTYLGTNDYKDLSADTTLLPNYVKDMYDIRWYIDGYTPSGYSCASGKCLSKTIYLAKCEANKDSIITDVGTNQDFIQYLKTIKDCDDPKRYRFIAEFYDEETKTYSYAWVEYPIINEEEGA